MATTEECRAALDQLANRLAAAQDAVRSRVDRRHMACRINDLGIVFTGELYDGGLHGIELADGSESAQNAQITLTMGSEDLIALTEGTLGVAAAWASGRLRIDAGFRDLLALRAMLS